MREVGAAMIGIGAMRGQLLEVVAGRERRSVGGDHDCANRRILTRRFNCRVQINNQLLRQTVSRLGAVEGQQSDAALGLPQQNWRLFRGLGAGRSGGHRIIHLGETMILM